MSTEITEFDPAGVPGGVAVTPAVSTMPTMNSLMDWHVGMMSDGFSEVRFVVADKNEARAWAIWIMDQDT